MRSACQDLWQRDRSDRRSELNVNVVNRACKQCLLRAKLYIIVRVRAKSCSCWKTIPVNCSMPVKIWFFFFWTLLLLSCHSCTVVANLVNIRMTVITLLLCIINKEYVVRRDYCCQPSQCEYSNVMVINLLLCIINLNKEYYSIGPKLCSATWRQLLLR